jgi:hypothetical protein
MILKEFTSHNASKLVKLTAALSENYNYNINLNKMTPDRAQRIADKALVKVTETRDVNQRVKFAMIAESLDLWMQANVQTELTAFNLAEGLGDDDLEASKVILAAQELSDKIQGMIEDAAKMQVQDLLPIVDAMKSELGQSESDAFAQSADAAIGGLVDSLKGAKSEYDNSISAAQGIDVGGDMDNFDMDGEDDMGMDVDMSAMDDDEMGMDDMGMDDEFGGDAAEIGDDDPTGREMKAEI